MSPFHPDEIEGLPKYKNRRWTDTPQSETTTSKTIARLDENCRNTLGTSKLPRSHSN